MSVRKRAALGLLALMALFISTAAVGPSAGAAPYVTNPTAKVNTTTPTEGGPITVSGNGFAPDAALTITLDNGAVLGTTTADASGAYSLSGTLPNGLTGTHTITVTDAAGNTATVTITIGSAASASGGPSSGSGGGGSGGTASGGSSGSGGVSNTGVAVMSIGGIGVLLLLGGAALVLAGKRRRASA